MGDTSENRPGNHICVGLLAHVDAGKTTLAESILYKTGSIRRAGRVDHGDAFLDTYALEKARGITIFSKQAELTLGEKEVTLLDTPGHVDFSAEMERTLQVLDYGILVISGADGVQGHVETLWRLLRRYRIPTFLFVNKMDQKGTDRTRLLLELQQKLSERCLDFGRGLENEETMEALAMCDEGLLEQYLETGRITEADIVSLIESRKVFPCYFGSALKMTGIEAFLGGFSRYTRGKSYPEEFGAKVYKISRDPQGTRLTHLKVTGGSLKVKQLLTNRGTDHGTGEVWEEKADQLRIYSGAGFRTVKEAPAGTVCAVAGLDKTYSGQGLGIEAASDMPLLEPVLSYRLELPAGSDAHQMFLKLCQLEEEEPLLHMVWMEQFGEIHVQVMGEVQIEVLKSLIQERFGITVGFGAGNIVYKETIKNTVEGVGHFEPLRHYAEVHLLMEPGEPGSGVQTGTDCREDLLDKNWQRLILTHLEEKKHRGVLTGAELTDIKLTLVAGKAHIKHTEGGDFRQATYRAVRQGLMQAESVLLEPVYEYRLEVPPEAVGRALSDLQKMHGAFGAPEQAGDMAVLSGTAPVVCMRGYQAEVTAYTRGRGRLTCFLKGYEPCHNQEEVMEAAGYVAESDLENPSGSVFCSHGAGFVVPWDQVSEYMHLEAYFKKEIKKQTPEFQPMQAQAADTGWDYYASRAEDKELEAIFARTYGPVKRKRSGFERTVYRASEDQGRTGSRTAGTGNRAGSTAPGAGNKTGTAGQGRKRPLDEKEYLLVDGYNIIFAWEELSELAARDIAGARGKLMDILSNYQGFKKCTVILVFDAYKVEGGVGEIYRYHNIHVVFTKEAETADQYIEKTVHEIGRKYRVTVATSDGLEQVIIMGQGARRLSARDFRAEVEAARVEIREICREKRESGRTYLFDHVSGEMAARLEAVRLGRGGTGEGTAAGKRPEKSRTGRREPGGINTAGQPPEKGGPDRREPGGTKGDNRKPGETTGDGRAPGRIGKGTEARRGKKA